MTTPENSATPISLADRAPRAGAGTQAGARTGRLDNLQTRRRLTGEQAQARSRNIRRLRLILPTLAGLMLVAFFFASQNAPNDDARLDDLTIESVMPSEAVVTKPRYSGLDRDGQPFEITADTAVQDNDNDGEVALTKPYAKLRDGNATTIATAKTGRYDDPGKILTLNGDVTLERTINGETFFLRAPQATVMIEQETVISQQGVTGESARGRLSADKVTVFNEDRRILFEGNVRMKFEPGAAKSLSGALQKRAASPKTP